MSPKSEHVDPVLKATQFATTHWSVVMAAGKPDSPQAAAALEKLCGIYWYPLYVYVRRRGFTPHDAEDVIQGFFGQLLGRQAFRDRTAGRGKFRSFLLASLNYYLADLYDRGHAAKRGSGLPSFRWTLSMRRSATGLNRWIGSRPRKSSNADGRSLCWAM